MTVLVALDGVLRTDSGTPVRAGKYLLSALIEAPERVVLLSEDTEAATEHWLATNGITGYAGVLTPAVDLSDGEPLYRRQIAHARAMGHVSMVVTADPEVALYCLQEISIAAMLIAEPRSTKPEYVERVRVPWAEAQKRVEKRMIREHLNG